MLLSLQWLWLVLLLYLTSFRGVDAQFPRPCTTPEARDSQTCCPLWKGSVCGSSAGRGRCVSLTRSLLPEPVDYRVNWPHAFYNMVCQCEGNYDGYDCSRCLPGWSGPECQQKHLKKRKEITDLTDSEREAFLSALNFAKKSTSPRYVILTSNDTTVEGNYEFHNSSVYDLYVWLHYYAAKTFPHSEHNAAHEGPAFLFWHRVFLLFIEREISELIGDPDFYIPYWDWTRTDHCNICNDQFFGESTPMGLINSSSPFSNWTTTCPFKPGLGIICDDTDVIGPRRVIRNPGKDPKCPTLPTAQDVVNTLAIPNFDTSPFDKNSKNSFRNKLEGFEIPVDNRHLNSSMHNLVHNYFYGTMSYVPTAANDPIFMVHHSFVDKILGIWLKGHPEATYPESHEIHPSQTADAFMAPFFPLRPNNYYWIRDTEELGYIYVEHSSSSFVSGDMATLKMVFKKIGQQIAQILDDLDDFLKDLVF